MTPEEKTKIEELEKRVIALEMFIQEKKVQQLSFPLDEVTKTIIRTT